MTRDEQDWREWSRWAERNRRDATLRGDLTIVRDNRADDELTDAEHAMLAQNEAELSAPTASDTAAELAALRDEVARLRAAMEDIHRLVMASYTPADATELHEAILPLLRAALEVTK